jgi:hypothetical protein
MYESSWLISSENQFGYRLCLLMLFEFFELSDLLTQAPKKIGVWLNRSDCYTKINSITVNTSNSSPKTCLLQGPLNLVKLAMQSKIQTKNIKIQYLMAASIRFNSKKSSPKYHTYYNQQWFRRVFHLLANFNDFVNGAKTSAVYCLRAKDELSKKGSGLFCWVFGNRVCFKKGG